VRRGGEMLRRGSYREAGEAVGREWCGVIEGGVRIRRRRGRGVSGRVGRAGW